MERQNKSSAEAQVACWGEIPDKPHYSLTELSQLCQVRGQIVRNWLQVLPQLSPVFKRGSCLYFSYDSVLLARKVRDWLYRDGCSLADVSQRLSRDKNKAFFAHRKTTKALPIAKKRYAALLPTSSDQSVRSNTYAHSGDLIHSLRTISSILND